jgi:hypothetical protein
MATVSISKDTATPTLVWLSVAATGRQAFAGMAAAVAESIRQHLVARDQIPNRLGGRRTHFYAAAARSTFWTASNSEGTVHIAKDGFRQRYLGGTIKPVKAKALAIPVSPESHGRTPAEFGSELRLVILGGTAANSNTTALLVLGNEPTAPVLFILVKQVTQEADPTVLPDPEAMQAEAISALEEILLATPP